MDEKVLSTPPFAAAIHGGHREGMRPLHDGPALAWQIGRRLCGQALNHCVTLLLLTFIIHGNINVTREGTAEVGNEGGGKFRV